MTPSELAQNIKDAEGSIEAYRHRIRQIEVLRNYPEIVEEKRQPLLTAFLAAKKALEAFDHEVLNADASIVECEQKISSLRARIKKWKSHKQVEKVADLKEQIAELEAEIAELQAAKGGV
jgi:peptidoglycan hydrolase CwlO-like protein